MIERIKVLFLIDILYKFIRYLTNHTYTFWEIDFFYEIVIVKQFILVGMGLYRAGNIYLSVSTLHRNTKCLKESVELNANN